MALTTWLYFLAVLTQYRLLTDGRAVKLQYRFIDLLIEVCLPKNKRLYEIYTKECLKSSEHAPSPPVDPQFAVSTSDFYHSSGSMWLQIATSHRWLRISLFHNVKKTSEKKQILLPMEIPLRHSPIGCLGRQKETVCISCTLGVRNTSHILSCIIHHNQLADVF